MLLKRIMTIITVGVCLSFIVSNIELANLEVHENRLLAMNTENEAEKIDNSLSVTDDFGNDCREQKWLDEFKMYHTDKQFQGLLEILEMTPTEYKTLTVNCQKF